MKKLFLNIRFLIEYYIILFLFFILYFFPISFASKIVGFLFRLFGKITKNHKTAMKNCFHVFPNFTKKQAEKIVLKSWENLGQTIFELGTLKKILIKNNIKTEGWHHIEKIIKAKKPSIFFSIHHSNWEICVPLLDKMGVNIAAIYRHINNHFIDKFVLEQRLGALSTNRSFYTPKGKQSAKDILEAIKVNNSIFLLVDQKDSAGENVIFFKKEIKTQLGFLKLARKYNMPLIPMENIRLDNGKFKIIFHEPLFHSKSDTDISMMKKIHNIIEKWIIKNPSQWFWQHNRFN